MGLDFESNNLGCVALSYGFLEIIKKANNRINDSITIILFEKCNIDDIKNYLKGTGIKVKVAPEISIKSISGFVSQLKYYSLCDVIFDFTAGDSFSDIYGKKRFFSRSFRKEMVLMSHTPLVLGSQTYGPFNNLFVRILASHIIKKSFRVFSRDAISTSIVQKLSGIKPIETVDIAFELPYSYQKTKHDSMIIGFNPSGLLWSGGYTGNNQFKLKSNYKSFCNRLIKSLIEKYDARIKLIAHVRSNNIDSQDNDLNACNDIMRHFPGVFEPPIYFYTPMQAKSYISDLDIFIGSRMHATIASYTTGVVTIPISYSRKFKGLFDSIHYSYCVDLCSENLEDSIRKIHKMIDNRRILKDNLLHNKPIINYKLKYLEDKITETLIKIHEQKV